MRALAALALCAFAWRASATTRIPQNMDKNLLNIIKHNLRRNNDDYKDRLGNDDVTPPAPRARRRDLDTFHPQDAPSTEGSEAVESSPTRTAVQPRPAPRAPVAAPREHSAAPREHSAAPRAPAAAPRKRFSGGRAGGTRPPPRADILDMAPARGNRIIAKRAKGRLCQRHVLLPEGPKYDSWGTAYLLAHSGRRPFAGTRAPRLLLPACCNCCKKSALGCE